MEPRQYWPSAERVDRLGWLMLCILARSDDSLPDEFFEAQLAAIEEQIHGRKDERYAMTSALMTFGGRAKVQRSAVPARSRTESRHLATDIIRFHTL